MKTPALHFGNDPFLVMSHFVKTSRRIQWSEIEFSHSLSLGAKAVGAFSFALRVAAVRQAQAAVKLAEKQKIAE